MIHDSGTFEASRSLIEAHPADSVSTEQGLVLVQFVRVSAGRTIVAKHIMVNIGSVPVHHCHLVKVHDEGRLRAGRSGACLP